MLSLPLAAAAQAQAYVFTYFTKNGEDGLHLAWSADGYRWEKLNAGKSYLDADGRQVEADARPVRRARSRRHVSHGVDVGLEREQHRLRLDARLRHLVAADASCR